MKTFSVVGVLMMVLLCCVSLPVAARLICYEGCDYSLTNTDLGGLNGGQGWNGPWAKTGAETLSVVSPGLTYNDGAQNLATRGYAFRGSYFGGGECRRAVQTTGHEHLLTQGCFGLIGTTNWISFLCQMEGLTYVPTGWFGVNLRRPSVQFFERTVFGHRPNATSQGWFVTNNWVVGGFGAPYTNAGVIVPGQTTFFVTRIIYGAPTADKRTITVWLNPSLAATPADNTGVTIPDWPMTYNFGGNPPCRRSRMRCRPRSR